MWCLYVCLLSTRLISTMLEATKDHVDAASRNAWPSLRADQGCWSLFLSPFIVPPPGQGIKHYRQTHSRRQREIILHLEGGKSLTRFIAKRAVLTQE